jgi:hypothetical protein
MAMITARVTNIPPDREVAGGNDDEVAGGTDAVEIMLGAGVAPTVVKLPVTQLLVRLTALERTRQW